MTMPMDAAFVSTDRSELLVGNRLQTRRRFGAGRTCFHSPTGVYPCSDG